MLLNPNVTGVVCSALAATSKCPEIVEDVSYFGISGPLSSSSRNRSTYATMTGRIIRAAR